MSPAVDARTGASLGPVDQLDAFVFRRVAEAQYAHLGGRGRGEGWAGIVRVDLADESSITTAVAEQRDVEHRSEEPARLFGPYWACEGVIVPLGRDELVVLGGAGSLDLSPDERLWQARSMSDRVGEVSPAKRLADELELLHAVKTIALTPLTHLDVVAERITAEAAQALSCEIAVLHLPGSGLVVVHDAGAPARVSTEDAATWVQALLPRVAGSTRCFQELRPADREGLPTATDQVVSLLSIPLDIEPGSMLVLAHTTGAARGFTDLCREIGTHIADAARTVLLAAVQHDRLRRDVEAADTRAVTDELTGLLNRRGWERALAAVPADAATVSVILADGNGLKAINDDQGHALGDEHIVAWADAVRASTRDSDPVARIGGDEFGVLLVGADAARCASIAASICRTLAEGALETSLAIGHATGTAADLRAVVHRADEAMYRHKGAAARC